MFNFFVELNFSYDSNVVEKDKIMEVIRFETSYNQ